MDGHAGHFDVGLHFNVFGAGGLEHFRRRSRSIFHERVFVVAVGHRNTQSRNTPSVFQAAVDLAIVVPTRQRFAERSHGNRVDAFLHGFLERSSVTLSVEVKIRPGAALKAITTNEPGMLAARRSVAETRNVNPVGPRRDRKSTRLNSS